MQKIIFTFALLITMINAYSQVDCYKAWKKEFDKKGAYAVVDGTYEDVILTIRKGDTSNCITAKVMVAHGNVTHMFLQKENGTYERLVKKFKYKTPARVQNGISITKISEQGEKINVIFYDKLKPEPSPYKQAPTPSEVLNND